LIEASPVIDISAYFTGSKLEKRAVIRNVGSGWSPLGGV